LRILGLLGKYKGGVLLRSEHKRTGRVKWVKSFLFKVNYKMMTLL